jgi:glucose-1-phosphate thymidylyltransferase
MTPATPTTPHEEATVPTTKAVILARGLGTRMRAADGGAVLDAAQARVADTGVKGMIPVGRPFLDHVIGTLADAGLVDVCLVVAPDHAAIRAHYDALAPRRLRLHYAVQPEPRGTADAVLAAEPFAAGAPFLVLNADNLYPEAALRALAALGRDGVAGFDASSLVAEGNIPAERIRAFALLVADAAGELRDLVEKPDDATWARLVPDAAVGMNLWSFTASIFEACRRTRPSRRGELELPDAVRIAMRELGVRFAVVPARGEVLDLSSRRDVATVAARLAGRAVSL